MTLDKKQRQAGKGARLKDTLAETSKKLMQVESDYELSKGKLKKSEDDYKKLKKDNKALKKKFKELKVTSKRAKRARLFEHRQPPPCRGHHHMVEL